jgi:hypothetical protein
LSLAETFARQAVVLNEQLNDGGRLSIYFDFINGLFNEAHLTEMKNRKVLGGRLAELAINGCAWLWSAPTNDRSTWI